MKGKKFKELVIKLKEGNVVRTEIPVNGDIKGYHAHLYDKNGEEFGCQYLDGSSVDLIPMHFFIDRRLRTKEFEWFILSNDTKNLKASLIFNDKDRSSNFSEDIELQKIKDNDPNVGDEFMRVHLFINTEESYDVFREQIVQFYDSMTHNLNVYTWLFVHFCSNSYIEAQKYLVDNGLNKNMVNILNAPKIDGFNHLNQD